MLGIRKLTPGYLDITPENCGRWKGKVLWYRTRNLKGSVKSDTPFRKVTIRDKVGDTAILQPEVGNAFYIKLRLAEFHASPPDVVTWTADDYVAAAARGNTSSSEMSADHRRLLTTIVRDAVHAHNPVSKADLLRRLRADGVLGVQGKPITRCMLGQILADLSDCLP